MTEAAVLTRKPLIESDRVEGTAVYDRAGNKIGRITRLMIDKMSGHVVYAVISLGGFLGVGSEEEAVAWDKLTYDQTLGGYRTDIADGELCAGASRRFEADSSTRVREQELHRSFDYFLARANTDAE